MVLSSIADSAYVSNVYIASNSNSKGSLISIENQEDYYNNDLAIRTMDEKRNIVFHRIDYQVNEKLLLGASEIILYGYRGIDLHYMPFVAFFTMKDYLGDLDNLHISLDLKYIFNKKLEFYSSIFIDELDPIKIFDKINQSWIGFQSGIVLINIFINSSSLIIEYV